MLEAMAAGLPVVAARAGGIPDILTKQGRTGYLYTPGGCSARCRAHRWLGAQNAWRLPLRLAARCLACMGPRQAPA